jgi:hypothetical protein
MSAFGGKAEISGQVAHKGRGEADCGQRIEAITVALHPSFNYAKDDHGQLAA